MRTFLIILASVLISILAMKMLPQGTNMDGKKENTFERIMRTGTIRCGYYVFPPTTYRDPNSKELSGLSVDMMNEIASRAGLKIEWSEEVNFSNWTAGLQANRFDIACTPMWPEVALARGVGFSKPLFYAGLYPLIRANDQKLLKASYNRFNQKDVRILTQDGNGVDVLTKATFPNATINSVSSTVDAASYYLDIVNGKSDMALGDKNGEIMYNENNPGTLKLRNDLPPAKVQSFTFAFNLGEPDLKNFMDNAVENLINDGTMDRLLAQWVKPGQYIPVKRVDQ